MREPPITHQRPQPDNFKTGAEYRWASRQWRAKHGGSMFANVAVAIIAGAITGSAVLLALFVVLAVTVTLARRSST